MASEQTEVLLGVLKLLADETRLKLLGLLTQREYSVKALAQALGVREPTVSHHLAKLFDHDIVSMRAEGTTHYYSLNRNALQAFKKDLFTTGQVETLVADVAEDAFERKVMSNFFEGDRLIEIPAAHKKRRVVVRWLANKFEMGAEYPQKEVNRVIKKYHPDTATLRRELLAFKFMTRERDTFTRISA